MALLHDDLFSNEIVDDPADLDLLVDGRAQEDNEAAEQPTGDNSDKDEKKDDKPEKKKRKQNLRPRLNILRLMDNNIGLTAAERVFKDVKFRGKGHELDDLNLIMKKMEIWAHKLYPSFDFDDCLTKLEKLGNKREVATYLKKLRMGLEDNIVAPQNDNGDDDNEDTNNENAEEIQVPPRADSPDRFDQLIRNQPQNEPTQGGLTEEQRERMRRNRLIAEQRRMARLKALHEKNENSATIQPENAVPNQSPFDTASHEHTSVNLNSQEHNPSELQNTSNSECPNVDSTNNSQIEKDVSLNINTELGIHSQDKDGKESVNLNSQEHNPSELQNTSNSECPNVDSTNNSQIEKDVSLNINTEIGSHTQDEDEKEKMDTSTLPTELPDNTYDFFEPMDDFEMAELP